MPNINLMPPPAFEKSLVPAFQTNFNRIRDAFARTANRISLQVVYSTGPWTHNFIVNHPFKADVMTITTASLFSTVGGMGGFQLLLDGALCTYWGHMWFNTPNVHTQLSVANMNPAVTAGNHTWTIQNVDGTTTSDINDRASIAFTMMETTT
jgi:hypothetical protein